LVHPPPTEVAVLRPVACAFLLWVAPFFIVPAPQERAALTPQERVEHVGKGGRDRAVVVVGRAVIHGPPAHGAVVVEQQQVAVRREQREPPRQRQQARRMTGEVPNELAFRRHRRWLQYLPAAGPDAPCRLYVAQGRQLRRTWNTDLGCQLLPRLARGRRT